MKILGASPALLALASLCALVACEHTPAPVVPPVIVSAAPPPTATAAYRRDSASVPCSQIRRISDTGQPAERIFEDSRHDHWYTAVEAREYGFVDAIAESFAQLMPSRKRPFGLTASMAGSAS